MSDPKQNDEGSGTESGALRAAKLLGVVISGRYRVDEILAVGGMGVVYRGTHVHMRKRVAIKVLLPETKGLPNLVARFEREAIAGAHIHHTNIASATDFGRLEDGSYFLIQEYARGTTLSAIIKRGPLALQRSVRIARQLASALKAAHEIGVIHRDMKPRNVMIDEERHDLVKLIDFGLSKVPVDQIASARDEDDDEDENRELTTVGVVFGTIAYMSPEAGLGMWAVDERSDLYALGIMLYEMLAGRHPFDGTEPGELFYQQRSVIPQPIATRTPGVYVPPVIEAIVTRLVQKDPTNRYQTAQELIDAIDGAMPGVSEIIIPPERVSSGAGTYPPPSSGHPAVKVRNSPAPTAATGSEGAPSSKGAERLPAVPAPPVATQVEIKEAAPSAPTSMTAPSTKPASPAAMKSAQGKPSPDGKVRATGPSQPAPLPPPPVLDADLPEESRPAATKKAVAPEKTPAAKKPAPAEAAKPSESRSSPSTSSPALVRPSQPSTPYVPLVPVRERRSRSSAAEWAVRIGALLVLAAAGVVFWMRGKGGISSFNDLLKPKVTTEAMPTATMVAATETAQPVGTGTGAALAATGAPAAPEQNGAALRDRTRAAAEKKQWDEGAKALVELAKTEPAAFNDKDVRAAAAQIAGGLAPAEAAKVLEALGAGEQGPDLLYDIGVASPDSPVGERAFELLDSKEVLDRASPALKITVELRKTPCMKKALIFKRVKKEGDQRTLDYLQAMHSSACNRRKGECCFPGNKLVEDAIRTIQARLWKK